MFPVLFLSFHAFILVYTLITIIILHYSIAIDIRDSIGSHLCCNSTLVLVTAISSSARMLS